MAEDSGVDEEVIGELMVLLAKGQHLEVRARLKAMGLTDQEVEEAKSHLSKVLGELQAKATRDAGRNRVLSILGMQLGLAAIAGVCFLLFGWVYESDGCILGLSLFGYCAIDSVLLTLIGTAGMTAGATCLMTFTAYFE